LNDSKQEIDFTYPSQASTNTPQSVVIEREDGSLTFYERLTEAGVDPVKFKGCLTITQDNAQKGLKILNDLISNPAATKPELDFKRVAGDDQFADSNILEPLYHIGFWTCRDCEVSYNGWPSPVYILMDGIRVQLQRSFQHVMKVNKDMVVRKVEIVQGGKLTRIFGLRTPSFWKTGDIVKLHFRANIYMQKEDSQVGARLVEEVMKDPRDVKKRYKFSSWLHAIGFHSDAERQEDLSYFLQDGVERIREPVDLELFREWLD